MASAIGVCLLTQHASADAVFRGVHPANARASGCSAQPRASGRNIFSPAVTSLLMLRCPSAQTRAGAFRFGAGCSPGAVKRAVPLLQNETQNMNTTENLIASESTANAPQPTNQVIKPIKFPAQPQEWKIVSLRECPTPETMQQCETPDQAAAYWKAHIATHPYFNSECECPIRRDDLSFSYGVGNAVGAFIRRNVCPYFCNASVNSACCCSFCASICRCASLRLAMSCTIAAVVA
jgi:hypothetical protein